MGKTQTSPVQDEAPDQVSSSNMGKSGFNITKSELVDSITQAIRDQIILKQMRVIQEQIEKEEYNKKKNIFQHNDQLKAYLKTDEGKKHAFKVLNNPEVQKKLAEIDVSGHQYIHNQFKDNFQNIKWTAGETSASRKNEIKDANGNTVCNLVETTKQEPATITLADGSEKTISSYRSIDFPKKLEGAGPLHVSMAVKDSSGKNIAASKAIYFTAHYDEVGKLTEVSTPMPLKFMGKGNNAIGYIERDGEIYTLPVTKDKYQQMMQQVTINNGIGINLSQQVDVTSRTADKIITPPHKPEPGQILQNAAQSSSTLLNNPDIRPTQPSIPTAASQQLSPQAQQPSPSTNTLASSPLLSSLPPSRGVPPIPDQVQQPSQVTSHTNAAVLNSSDLQTNQSEQVKTPSDAKIQLPPDPKISPIVSDGETTQFPVPLPPSLQQQVEPLPNPPAINGNNSAVPPTTQPSPPLALDLPQSTAEQKTSAPLQTPEPQPGSMKKGALPPPPMKKGAPVTPTPAVHPAVENQNPAVKQGQVVAPKPPFAQNSLFDDIVNNKFKLKPILLQKNPDAIPLTKNKKETPPPNLNQMLAAGFKEINTILPDSKKVNPVTKEEQKAKTQLESVDNALPNEEIQQKSINLLKDAIKDGNSELANALIKVSKEDMETGYVYKYKPEDLKKAYDYAMEHGKTRTLEEAKGIHNAAEGIAEAAGINKGDHNAQVKANEKAINTKLPEASSAVKSSHPASEQPKNLSSPSEKTIQNGNTVDTQGTASSELEGKKDKAEIQPYTVQQPEIRNVKAVKELKKQLDIIQKAHKGEEANQPLSATEKKAKDLFDAVSDDSEKSINLLKNAIKDGNSELATALVKISKDDDNWGHKYGPADLNTAYNDGMNHAKIQKDLQAAEKIHRAAGSIATEAGVKVEDHKTWRKNNKELIAPEKKAQVRGQ